MAAMEQTAPGDRQPEPAPHPGRDLPPPIDEPPGDPAPEQPPMRDPPLRPEGRRFIPPVSSLRGGGA
jgi:hypothetical protein